jgi:nucleoside-diphosphate-sugar epimerase
LIAGCGYVGGALARQLHARGATVYGLRRDPSALPAGVRPIAADLTAPESLGSLPEGLDAIVYAASASQYGEAAYRAAYVDGVENLLRAVASRPPGRLVFTSSTGVYGQDDGTWLDETSPADADRPTAQALRDGEARVLHGDIPGTVVRLSGIYGPGRTRLIDSVRTGRARLEQGPTRYLNHIHRDDCAGALAHVLALPNPASLYLATDDEPRPRNDLLCWIADRLGLPEPPYAESAPGSARSSERGGNRRYRNQRLRESGYHLRFPTFREGYGSLIAGEHASG